MEKYNQDCFCHFLYKKPDNEISEEDKKKCCTPDKNDNTRYLYCYCKNHPNSPYCIIPDPECIRNPELYKCCSNSDKENMWHRCFCHDENIDNLTPI
jgi:hypothetical protein